MSRSERAVFRLPGAAILIPFLLFVCVTPLATVGAAFWLALYLLPIVGLAYVLFTRTVADAEVIRTTGLLGGRRIPWSELDGLEFHGPRWAIAVGTGGRRFRLPMVRPRDLPRLAQVSGGRLLLGRDAPVEPEAGQPEIEQVEAEQVEAEQVGVEQVGVEQVEAEQVGVEQVGVEQVGVEQVGVEQVGVEQVGVEDAGVEKVTGEPFDAGQPGPHADAAVEVDTHTQAVVDASMQDAAVPRSALNIAGTRPVGG